VCRFRASSLTVRRPLVWLLALAIVAYGHTAAVVQLLGSTHRHETPSSSSVFGELAQDTFREILAWRAELRAHVLGPLLSREGAAHAHGQAQAHAQASGHAHPSAHAHAGFARHHHDPHDDSVVSLGATGAGGTPDAPAPGASTSTGGTLPLLGFAPPAPLAVQPVLAWAWPAAPADRWIDAAQRPPERPPRA
jgi:hypothetical protein